MPWGAFGAPKASAQGEKREKPHQSLVAALGEGV